MSEETLTFVVIPDTQVLAARRPEGLAELGRWVSENAARFAIDAVLHVGDVVDAGGRDPGQFLPAAAALGAIRDAGIPVLVAPGNHDYDDLLAQTRGLRHFDGILGPIMADSWAGLPSGTSVEGGYANSFVVVPRGDRATLYLALEYGPTAESVAWASAVLASRPTTPAIIVTHGYLDPNGERGSARSHCPPTRFAGSADGLNGTELWDRLVSSHENVRAVFCGHELHGLMSHRVDVGVHGNPVLQAFQNWQAATDPEVARLRLVQWHPSSNAFRLRVVNATTGAFEPGPGGDVHLDLNNPDSGEPWRVP